MRWALALLTRADRPERAVQVHVYLPGKAHPAHDTVRAIVKDSTDTFQGDSSRVWIDSGASQEFLPAIYGYQDSNVPVICATLLSPLGNLHGVDKFPLLKHLSEE